MEKSQIVYNIEAKLSVPDGNVLASIKVSIEMTPPNASCLIYGYSADGNIIYVQIDGSGVVDLPFAMPQIFIKYLGDCEGLRLSTLGWALRR